MTRLKNILRHPKDIHSRVWLNENTSEPIDVMKAIRGISPNYNETDNPYLEETKTPRSIFNNINDRTNTLDKLKKEYYQDYR